jgi:hypothetical protein
MRKLVTKEFAHFLPNSLQIYNWPFTIYHQINKIKVHEAYDNLLDTAY